MEGAKAAADAKRVEIRVSFILFDVIKIEKKDFMSFTKQKEWVLCRSLQKEFLEVAWLDAWFGMPPMTDDIKIVDLLKMMAA